MSLFYAKIILNLDYFYLQFLAHLYVENAHLAFIIVLNHFNYLMCNYFNHFRQMMMNHFQIKLYLQHLYHSEL